MQKLGSEHDRQAVINLQTDCKLKVCLIGAWKEGLIILYKMKTVQRNTTE